VTPTYDNPGSHDDVPSTTELKVIFGNLRHRPTRSAGLANRSSESVCSSYDVPSTTELKVIFGNLRHINKGSTGWWITAAIHQSAAARRPHINGSLGSHNVRDVRCGSLTLCGSCLARTWFTLFVVRLHSALFLNTRPIDR
jgi:hypothetical protein